MADHAQPSNTTGEYAELPVIEGTPAVELDQIGEPGGRVIPQPSCGNPTSRQHRTVPGVPAEKMGPRPTRIPGHLGDFVVEGTLPGRTNVQNIRGLQDKNVT